MVAEHRQESSLNDDRLYSAYGAGFGKIHAPAPLNLDVVFLDPPKMLKKITEISVVPQLNIQVSIDVFIVTVLTPQIIVIVI